MNSRGAVLTSLRLAIAVPPVARRPSKRKQSFPGVQYWTDNPCTRAQHGCGFERLLRTISDLTRKPILRPAAPHVDNKPVQARWDGDGHYAMECPDCLRPTTVPRGPRFTHGEHITTCRYCRGVILVRIEDGDSSESAAHNSTDCTSGNIKSGSLAPKGGAYHEPP